LGFFWMAIVAACLLVAGKTLRAPLFFLAVGR
jgi:hypothetical protein